MIYIRIEPTGREAAATAEAWGEGPKVSGKGEIVWCVSPERTWVPVLVSARRHRSRGKRGRWMDPGEAYTDPQVAQDALRAPVERPGWPGKASPPLWRTEGGRKVQERAVQPPWRRWAGPGDRCIRVKELPTDVYKTLSGEG